MRSVYMYTVFTPGDSGKDEARYISESTNPSGHVFKKNFGSLSELVEWIELMVKDDVTTKEHIFFGDQSIQDYFQEHSEVFQEKASFTTTCGECQKSFENGEIAYYTWYENRVFCSECRDKMNKKVTPKYLDWQIRKIHLD